SPSPFNFIPAIVESRWRNATLPTLTHLLGSSTNPFECDFDDIEDAFKAANPNCPYKMVPGCAVNMKFGTTAIQVVLKFFQTEQFTKASDPTTAIADFVAYALQPEGPMLYRIPAPLGLRKNQAEYTAPKGFCESDFFIDTLSPFVKKMAGSKKDYGNIPGAIGLTAAALEKTFMMFKTGTFVRDPDAFSRENVGDIVDDYITNALAFPSHRWDRIMGRCGATIKKAAPSVGALSMDNQRHNLYIASSP
ncbi:hypothetical protein B0H13DRAFT_1651482, partial [Mycena leptocephala]